MSQLELGALLGVSKGAISKYENGRCHLPVTRLMACEIIFGISAAELLIAVREAVEDRLSRRALAFHDRIEGKTDAASLKKLKLLNEIKDRLHMVDYDL